LSIARKAAFAGPGLRFVMFLHDISARTQSELALRDSEARFHDLFSKNTSVMLLIEPDSGEIVDANAAAVAYYGYTRERLVGMSINAINTLPPERVADERARARRGECTTFFFSHRLASGSVRDVEVHLTPIESGGRPLLFSIVNDITARKRAEESLSKLSLAVEQSPESIVITDLDARIEYVNEAFVRKTGYTRAEIIGANPRLLKSGRTPPETYRVMWDALTAGDEWRGDFFNRRKDGSEYLESAIIAPLRSPEGKITHYIGIKEDITGRRRLYDEPDSGA
jgi:PAS domain S-box-containing protein